MNKNYLNKFGFFLLIPFLFIIVFLTFLMGINIYEIKEAIANEKNNTLINLLTNHENEPDINDDTNIIKKSFISMNIANNESDCKSIVASRYNENFSTFHSPVSFFYKNNSHNNIILLYEDSFHNGICKIFDTSGLTQCLEFFNNQSYVQCTDGSIKEEKDDNNSIDKFVLDPELFSQKGLLLADTKFNHQYDFEIKNTLDNNNNQIRVSLDFNEHSQSNNNDINSPRLEIVRENSDGIPNMTIAKNQTITWQGNIKEYFEDPNGKFKNETYITFQFNTGHHGSNNDDEERGLGVLFDVSGSSNPNIFQYRDNGEYTKYDYYQIRELAGDENFIFHNTNENKKPIFMNNLTNKDNVKLEVKSILFESNNTRTIETFVDNGSGIYIPYWTLNNLFLLKESEKIENEDEFIQTLLQGSGYVIARTDNVDTRVSVFRSTEF